MVSVHLQRGMHHGSQLRPALWPLSPWLLWVPAERLLVPP